MTAYIPYCNPIGRVLAREGDADYPWTLRTNLRGDHVCPWCRPDHYQDLPVATALCGRCGALYYTGSTTYPDPTSEYGARTTDWRAHDGLCRPCDDELEAEFGEEKA